MNTRVEVPRAAWIFLASTQVAGLNKAAVEVASAVAGVDFVPTEKAAPPAAKQIYLLQQTDTRFYTSAQTNALVVRAACETCARSVAAGEAGTEGPAVWRDPERSTCKRVNEDGKSGVVLRSEG